MAIPIREVGLRRRRVKDRRHPRRPPTLQCRQGGLWSHLRLALHERQSRRTHTHKSVHQRLSVVRVAEFRAEHENTLHLPLLLHQCQLCLVEHATARAEGSEHASPRNSPMLCFIHAYAAVAGEQITSTLYANHSSTHHQNPSWGIPNLPK